MGTFAKQGAAWRIKPDLIGGSSDKTTTRLTTSFQLPHSSLYLRPFAMCESPSDNKSPMSENGYAAALRSRRMIIPPSVVSGRRNFAGLLGAIDFGKFLVVLLHDQGHSRGFGAVRPTSAFPPNSRRSSEGSACPKGADTVAKVENRTIPKISQKLIFRRLYRCNAL
jgi:hypothetical protein